MRKLEVSVLGSVFSALTLFGHSIRVETLPDEGWWDDYGVDGFKFDAGDIYQFKAPYVTHGKAAPSELCEAHAKIGLEFSLNEYRACFKMGGQPFDREIFVRRL